MEARTKNTTIPPPAMEIKAFIRAIQVLAELSFVLNKFVPLMVMLNALLATLFLVPASMVPATVILILIIVVMVKSQDAYTSLLKA